MAAKRGNVNGSTIDFQLATSVENNFYAGAKKTVSVGPFLQFAGLLNAEVDLGTGAQCWVYNNSGTVGFVATYPVGVAATPPSSPSTGIPIPPNAYMQIGLGLNCRIIGSAATLACYKVMDDTNINLNTNQPF
jgi:hypothetical protein